MSEQPSLWVRSEVASDGSYIAVVEFTADENRALDADAAGRYAAAVLAAVAAAEYDAAIFHQLANLGGPIDEDAIVMLVRDLRADRPPIDDAATAPLRFVPGVSHRPGHPAFILLELHGKPIGQLDVDDARGHAMHVLEVLPVAALDGLYRQLLVGLIGLDDTTARAVVGNLAEHR